MTKFLLVLLASAALYAQPTVPNVQSAPCLTDNAGSSIIPKTGSCAIGGSASAGNVMVALVVSRGNTASAISSISTTKTSGYTKLKATTSGAAGVFAEIWCGNITTTGVESAVATANGTIFFGHMFLAEVAGTNGCNMDGPGSGTSNLGGSTTMNPGSLTTTLSNSILLNAAYSNSSTGVITLTAGFNVIGLNNTGSTERLAGAQYLVVPPSSYNPTITSPAGSWSDVLVALQASGGVGASKVRHQTSQ